MRSSLLVATISTVICGAAQASPTFIPLLTPGAQVSKISQNGEYISAFVGAGGSSGAAGMRWVRATGVEEVVTGSDFTNGVNNLGSIAGAVAQDGGQNGGGHDLGAYFPLVGTPVLAAPQLQPDADVYDVADDNTMVGLSFDGPNYTPSLTNAFVWTPTGGMVRLPTASTTTPSRANSISADASVIGGWNDDPITGQRYGIIWSGPPTYAGPYYPTDENFQLVGEADAVSGNGQFVVGQGLSGNSWLFDATSFTVLTLQGMPFAFGVSDDGNTVVGNSGFFDDPPRAMYVWTRGGGPVLFSTFLANQGVTVPAGWDLSGGLAGISGDGTVMAGWGFNNSAIQSFVVTGLTPDLIFRNGFE